MTEIKFEEVNGYCSLECEHKMEDCYGRYIRIGSKNCKDCLYNEGRDLENKIVKCSYGE